MSDIHGNVEALRAVLRELKNELLDDIVVAGDIVIRGLHDAECIDVLRDLSCVVIAGNADLYVVTGELPVTAKIQDDIGPERTAFLAALPREHRITPQGGCSPDDDLLVVHASPRDIGKALIVEKHPLYPYQLTPLTVARRLIGGARANLIVGGHVHYSQSGLVGRQRFASISPVSCANDGDPRAGYAIATWDGRQWKLENRRVEYDVEAVADEIEHSDIEQASRWAEELRSATVRSHFDVEHVAEMARRSASLVTEQRDG